MVGKLVAVTLACACLTIAACNTVSGAGADVQSVANCTEDLMKQGKC